MILKTSLIDYIYLFIIGAIDAIINQIKGGRFSLKATDKDVSKAITILFLVLS